MSKKPNLQVLCAVILGFYRFTHAAATLTTILSFATGPAGTETRVIPDANGNLFGTTYSGGINNFGSVFELSGPQYQTMATLVNFSNANGDNITSSFPRGLAADATGNLYLAASGGGTAQTAGQIFKLSGLQHSELTTVASFIGTNGGSPQGDFTFDEAGNLYGTTGSGGANGYGTAFELSGPGHQTLTTLASFNNTNGNGPHGGLTVGADGNLYGTTWLGGANGDGTVFELSGPKHQTLTTLVSFNSTNGIYPLSGLTQDATGNLYGTTEFGGTNYEGTVFELSGPDHRTFRTLVNFTGLPNGSVVVSGLIADAASAPSHLNFRIDAFQLDPRVVDLHLPFHALLSAIDLVAPGRGFLPQHGHVAETSSGYALTRH